MRLFVAINLPENIKDVIQELEGSLRIKGDFIRWTEPANVHLTLKFLGEVTPSLLDEIERLLAQSLSHYAPFEIAVEGIGAFPNLRNPRVVWIGIRGENGLNSIYRAVGEVFSQLGFESESRPFKPHLTIGRVKRRKGPDATGGRSLEDRVENVHLDPMTFRVTSIELMESILKPSGAIYRVRASIALSD
jgi:2'-5' RNA ligase